MSLTKRYFGSDGIRGKAHEPPITPEFIYALGVAFATALEPQQGRRILVARDTRSSGEMIEASLAKGMSDAGFEVCLAGILPSPAVGWKVAVDSDYIAGCSITASHNPPEYNGVKFFLAEGNKPDDAFELAVESGIGTRFKRHGGHRGRVTRVSDCETHYSEFCRSSLPEGMNLDGLHLVVDCANGAGYRVVPAIFEALGARVECLGVSPNGHNINLQCGAGQHELLVDSVVSSRADLGIAIDGDGDRVLLVSQNGVVLDGDDLLFMIAVDQLQRGVFKGGIVGTPMTNTGLVKALAKRGIPFERVQVGDRYVQAELRKRGWQLGGENSGHIFCLQHSPVCDAVISGLQAILAWLNSRIQLAEWKKEWQPWVQRLINLPFPVVQSVGLPRLIDTANRLSSGFKENARIMVRPSGTEPVIRVLIEAEDCKQLADCTDEWFAGLKAETGQDILSEYK